MSCAVSVRHGLAWLRIGSLGWSVKAPWCRPLFSERNGLRVPIASAFGFRLFLVEGFGVQP